MFITKSYKNNSYLIFNHPVTGNRTKMTLKNLEKVLNDYFTSKPAETLTLSRLEEEVVKFVSANHSQTSIENYKYAFKKLIEILGDISLSSLSVAQIEHYKRVRSLQVRKTSVNVELRVIKSFLNMAVKWEFLEKRPEITLFKIPQSEPAVLTSSDIDLLLPLLPSQTLRDIILFAFLSGCRLSEILNLQICDIDLNSLILVIRNKADFKTKTGKIRRIPISGKLEELLRGIIFNNNILPHPETYLFNKNGVKIMKDYVSKQFKKALRSGGFGEKFHFHSLRHSFVTGLIRSGVPLNHVMLLAGHNNIQTTMVYTHLVTEDLREAVNRI